MVGGGHNGLTAAAYLAKAGNSVLVLERRERLGGACTLERPFADPRYEVSPCAYVVGSPRRARHRRARPQAPRPARRRRRPEPLGPVHGRDLVRPVARRRPHERRPQGPERLTQGHRRLLGVRAPLRRDPPPAAHRRARHVGRRVAQPRRARGAPPRRADDDRRPLRRLDRRGPRRPHERPAAQGRALRPGRDRRLGGPEGQGHRLDQAHALPGRPRGPGTGVGLRARRHGDGLVRDRRRRAGGRRDPGRRRPRRRDPARGGRPARGRHADRGPHRRQQRRPQAHARDARRPARRLQGPHRRLADPQPGGQVQRLAHAPAHVDRSAAARTSPPARPSTSPPASTRRSARSSAAREARPPSASARSTCRPATTRRPRRPAGTS